MGELSQRNFGRLIAYLVPGYIALWGVGALVPGIEPWLLGSVEAGPTIGGFLYLTVGCVAAGMFASAVRWAVVDTVHHATGLERPAWNDALLHERLRAYEWLIENHYRHYQFYGNTLFAVAFTYVCWRVSLPDASAGVGWLDGAVLALSIVLAAGSRTTLARYYRRTESVLGTIAEGEAVMANGGHPKPPGKPESPGPKTSGPAKPTSK